MPKATIIKGTEKAVRKGSAISEQLNVAPYCRVSTDSDEQLESYKAQVEYYTDLVNSKSKWNLVDIYADEGLSGTQTKKREDFNRMIDDCMNGKIDMVITRSISRFARNTVDTLTYVRKLKERGVDVFFEKENINTIHSDGEVLLTILSSIAQQEVENISANVKLGLKARMKDGTPIGFHHCLGYDYDKVTKEITINKKEAEIVEYIFKRYIEGAGCPTIANELTARKDWKSPYGHDEWSDNTVLGIIKNTKYKGVLLQGRSYTSDPIAKKRLKNLGEKDMYLAEGTHEAIIPAETFDEAQAILNRRGEVKPSKGKRRDKYSRQYPFSSKIYCAFCGSVFSRRNWYAGTEREKRVWACAVSVKEGKKECPDSTSIIEQELEQAFVEAFRLMCSDNKDIISEFIQRVESTLNENSYTKELVKADKAVASLNAKVDKLLDTYLNNSISKERYDSKHMELLAELEEAEQRQQELYSAVKDDSQLKKRISEFKKVLEQNNAVTEFDPAVFESVIEKIIIGETDEDGNKDPYKITFVFKTGYTSEAHQQPRSSGRKRRGKGAGGGGFTGDLMCSYGTADIHITQSRQRGIS